MTNILAVSSNKIWRNDITGLRAVAVLPVLLFHAFPEIFPGGFYGVDVFFVISGYLISGIIFRDVLANSFSYSDFYIRRIRRIFPNLILLLVFVAVVVRICTITASPNCLSCLTGNLFSMFICVCILTLRLPPT